MEDCIKKLNKDIKCRDSLIKYLYTLLYTLVEDTSIEDTSVEDTLVEDETMFQSIFIFGHVSCGKSFILQKLLEYLNYNVSIINCLEHVSNRSMFEKIVVDLSGVELKMENGYKLKSKCDDFVGFISQIKSIAEADRRPMVIVLEKCEKLRDLEANLLPALLRLRELTMTNVCTIFTSDVIWEKYYPKTGLYEPIRIFFPQYTKDEVSEILLHSTRPCDYSVDFYKNYLNLFLSVFYRFCRDLNELRYMAKKNFPKYIEPIENKIIAETDSSSLWRHIRGIFKTNLEVIYLRVSANDFDQQSELSHNIESTVKLALSFELPWYAKYILIAAYLASYNPPKEDRRLFMKEGGPKKKRSYKSKKKKPQVMTTREGPKSFPLSRLLAIFCCILGEKVDLNAILMTQIPSMCQLGLLSISNDNNIDEPKYKCCIDFQFATVISKNLGFELTKYLYDFLH